MKIMTLVLSMVIAFAVVGCNKTTRTSTSPAAASCNMADCSSKSDCDKSSCPKGGDCPKGSGDCPMQSKAASGVKVCPKTGLPVKACNDACSCPADANGNKPCSPGNCEASEGCTDACKEACRK